MTTDGQDSAQLGNSYAQQDRDLESGMVVGEYQIEGKLGEGGFGAVYRAVHPVIGKYAAVKVLHRQYSSNPDMVGRFVDEARAVNQIRHRNIIDIFAFGRTEDGRQYYVMEMLEGMTLDRFIKERGGVKPEIALPILRQVARALDAAHASGVAHRDLKPENIFLCIDEEGVIDAKLLDFGIAKLLGDSTTGRKTQTGTPMGTPLYMSPEQCRGRGVDHRTDIYSFGIVCHEALTGKVPFDSDSVMDLMLKQTAEPPPPMSSVNPAVASALDGPVLAMLAKEPAERPATVTEAIDQLIVAASGVGHDVSLPTKSISGPRVGDAHPMHAKDEKTLSAGDREMAEAKTMLHSDVHQTLEGTSIAASPNRRTAMLVAVGALIAGIAGTAIVVARGVGDGGSETASAANSVREILDSSAAPKPPAPPPEVVPSAKPVPPPTEASVSIRFQANVEGATVFEGEDELGSADEPIELTKSDTARTLTLRLEGYEDREIEVAPKGDLLVPVELAKRKGAAVGANSNPPPKVPPGPPPPPPPGSGGPSQSELEF